MAESSTPKGKKDKNKKILIGLGIVVVGIAIWLLMRRKKASDIFLNITNYSATNYAPLTDAQIKSELDKANALVESKGVDGTITDLQSQVATLEAQGTPESLALAKLLKDFIADLQLQKENQVKSATGGSGSMSGSMIGSMGGGTQTPSISVSASNGEYAPLTPSQIQSEVDATNASLITNGVQSTLNTLNSRINQLSGSTNPSDIAMSSLLQNLASQLSGLASSSGTPYGSTSSSMGLPNGMTMGGTTMAGGATMGTTTSGMTMNGIPYAPTTMSMGLPTTMTPSTMLNIPVPVAPAFSLSNPIIHTCGTYTSWFIAGANPLYRQPDPQERTGQEFSMSIPKFGGGNRIEINVLPTNGLPSIVPFMLVKLTVTVINKSAFASKVGINIGFTNPNNTTSSTTSYGYLQGIKMFTITKEEIGTTGAVFTLSGVVPLQGGNRLYIQADNSLIPFAEWQNFDIKVKVQTGGCVSGAIVNTPLNISTGNMLTSGSVNDLLTRPTTTTTTPTTTSPTSPITTRPTITTTPTIMVTPTPMVKPPTTMVTPSTTSPIITTRV